MPARSVSDRKPLYAKPNPSTEAANWLRLNCVESMRDSRIGKNVIDPDQQHEFRRIAEQFPHSKWRSRAATSFGSGAKD